MPGAGKTAILRLLEISGYLVVEEAATDVIALGNALGREQPWHEEFARAAGSATVFFDRSQACTLALSRYLGVHTSALLNAEVSRVVADRTYEPTVFFIHNQGFVRPTAARQISFADSLIFERLHEQVYRELGFQLVDVPAGPLPERVALIRRTVGLTAKRAAPGKCVAR